MQGTPDWQRLLENIGTVTIPILVMLWNNRRKTKDELEQKHKENVEMFNTIVLDRKLYTPHEHLEREGELRAENIRKAPSQKYI